MGPLEAECFIWLLVFCFAFQLDPKEGSQRNSLQIAQKKTKISVEDRKHLGAQGI